MRSAVLHREHPIATSVTASNAGNRSVKLFGEKPSQIKGFAALNHGK
jgi:hypothetical protein